MGMDVVVRWGVCLCPGEENQPKPNNVPVRGRTNGAQGTEGEVGSVMPVTTTMPAMKNTQQQARQRTTCKAARQQQASKNAKCMRGERMVGWGPCIVGRGPAQTGMSEGG